MPRVPIKEFAAKKMILGDEYRGSSLFVPAAARTWKLPKLDPKQPYVVKVDQGVKQRMKKGLAALPVWAKDISKIIERWRKAGYESFLIEPLVKHEPNEERYLSFERTRRGVRATYSPHGGIDIEEHKKSLEQREIVTDVDGAQAAEQWQLPESFMERILMLFANEHCSLIEMNPLVVSGGKALPLDAAVLVDDTAQAKAWSRDDQVHPPHTDNVYEKRIEKLAKTTPASLKLRVMNPDGAFFFLLSGGGGSLALIDAVHEAGQAELIGNYGEYSGGPSREETYLYSKTVIELMLASKAKKKVLIIAGGTANFTDIKTTLAGIVDALGEHAKELAQHDILVAVRRGGPREREGLEALSIFLQKKGIPHTVHDSREPITTAIDDALAFMKKK